VYESPAWCSFNLRCFLLNIILLLVCWWAGREFEPRSEYLLSEMRMAAERFVRAEADSYWRLPGRCVSSVE
jgi:hypothetical protein